MKYGLIGNFGHSNLGDEAILRGMVSLLETNNKDFVVYSDNISNSEQMFGVQSYFRLLRPRYEGNPISGFRIFVKLIRAVMSVDVVIIGGGGLFNHINKTAFYQYLFIMLIAALSFRRLIIAGVSVGPLKGKINKTLLRFISLKADFVLTRDASSLTYFLNKKKGVVPDISLGFLNVSLVKCARHKRLGISVMDVTNSLSGDLHAKYKEKISKIVTEIIKANLFEEIVLFGMDHDKDLVIAHEINSQFSGEIAGRVRVVEMKNLNDIDSFFNSVDFIVGTRLHASILSILYSKIFLAISYQDKVSDYFKANGFEKNLIGILDFINEDVVRRIINLNVQSKIDSVNRKKLVAYNDLQIKFKDIL